MKQRRRFVAAQTFGLDRSNGRVIPLCSGYMQQAVAESLRPSGGRYEAVAPALPPVAGAVLMALSQCGRAGDELATCLEQSLPAEAWPGGDVPAPV